MNHRLVVLLVLAFTVVSVDATVNDDNMIDEMPTTNAENVTLAEQQSTSLVARVILLKNTTLCTMYSKRCFIRMVILEPASIRKGLKVKIASKKFVEFKSLESCLQNNTLVRRECRAFDNYTNIFQVNH